MILSDAAIRNRRTVSVLIALIVAMGLWSYVTLPREAAPDVPIPVVLVTTRYEGAVPEDVETLVTMKIEKELAGLKGLKEISSTSAEEVSTVVIEFQPDIVIDDALQYVRDRVDIAKGELDDEVDDPLIKELNIAEFPIILISISGRISPVRLERIADELEDAIELVPGVLNVDVSGALEREIRVEVDPDRLSAYNLTLEELMRLVPSENVNVSAGGLETEGTKFNVRVPAEFVEPDEVDHLLLAIRDGKPIYLRDIATVTDTFKDRLTYSRLDGVASITLSVQKRIGADIIPISDGVRATLQAAARQMPQGVRLEVIDDQADYVRMMVRDLENNILSGLILVVCVLFLFMGWRTSTIVALAIPMSMLMSFAIVDLLGYTLNMVVLFSLVFSLGMLVDNAIVIVENIYRHMQAGKSRAQAARDGAAEVAWPVITSTATTVAAFFPLLFWPGVMGGFMKYLPIGVIVMLSSSLFVALIITPTLCSLAATGKLREPGAEHPVLRAYRRALEFALRHRGPTIGSAVLVLVAVAVVYGAFGRGLQFFPEPDPDQASVELRFPQGTHIRETDRLARVVEERIEPFREEFKHVVATVGSGGRANPMFGGGSTGPHVSSVTMIFKDYEERTRPSADAVREIRKRLTDLVGAEIKVQRPQHGPPTGAAVTVRIAGEEFATLAELSGTAKRMITGVPGLVNLRSDFEGARPELILRVDRRRAKLLGVNTQVVGRFLKTAIFGSEVGAYREFNDEYDITVRLPLSRRQEIEDLFRLRVPNLSGHAVPLSSLGTFEYQGGLGTITRIDQKRVVTLTGDAEGRLSPAVLRDVQHRLGALDLPPGYHLTYAGEKEEQDEAIAFLSKAFVIALFLIVMILVTQFNSFSAPFIITSTVVLSLIGVLVGLLVCHMPFGVIMTGIGCISLAGVVVNNAIVLLVYARQLQREGLDLLEAIVRAGQTRLRPVLLTAVTTILGLLPMATGVAFDFREFRWVWKSMSSEWWSSMAIAVIFGLAFATVLTLVIVPTLYVSFRRRPAGPPGGPV